MKVGKIGAVPTIEISPQGENKTIYAGLLNGTTVIAAGTRQMLTDGIARATAARPAIKPGLEKLLETTRNTQAFSMVVTKEGIANTLNDAPGPLPDNINDQVTAIDGLSLNLTVGKDVSFQVAADAKDNEMRREDAEDGELRPAHGPRHDRQECSGGREVRDLVLDLANTLRVAQQGQNVTLRGEISAENFDRLMALIPKK